MVLGIITGGESGEREVSLASAKNIQSTLSIPDYLVFDFPSQLQEALEAKVDVFMPIIHGVGGEDGEVQVELEKKGIPYTFSSPESHKTALDKILAKEIVSKVGIVSPREYTLSERLVFPIFVKPKNGGSSVSTFLISDDEELAVFEASHKREDFLLEQVIKGREFSVGVINVDGKDVSLPVIEIRPKSSFFDYESKYSAINLAEEVCPAGITDSLRDSLQEQALKAHQVLGCKHLSRSDFIVTDDGSIFFLETNTIPGMTETSLLPKSVAVAGHSLKDLFIQWAKEVYTIDK